MRLRELALARPRYGYRRLYILIRRDGWKVNHKRVFRVYREEGLQVRTVRRRKKATRHLRIMPPNPTRPNERWTIDFVSDALSNGRKIRALTVLDIFTRECLAIEVAHSIPSARVTEVLDGLIGLRKKPMLITLDNVLSKMSSIRIGYTYPSGPIRVTHLNALESATSVVFHRFVIPA